MAVLSRELTNKLWLTGLVLATILIVAYHSGLISQLIFFLWHFIGKSLVICVENITENNLRCQIEVLRVQKSDQTCWICIISCKKCKNWKWPLVCSNPNISASTWPKLKIKDSFEILRTSKFQNWPSFLNLVKIWGRYYQKNKLTTFFVDTV